MNLTTKRICRDAILLAVLCVIGMFSIPFGNNVKVSLQFLMILMICFVSNSVIDPIIITGCYLGLGMFLPIYAGFNSGISPTYGYVIGFVVVSIPITLISKIKSMNEIARLVIASVVGLVLLYIIGTVFIMLYLEMSLDKAIIYTLLPYIPFDIFKIVLAITLYKLLPKRIME